MCAPPNNPARHARPTVARLSETTAMAERFDLSNRHPRACPEDPRLFGRSMINVRSDDIAGEKTWMAGTRPVMTVKSVERAAVRSRIR
jgi:hypothetical protein